METRWGWLGYLAALVLTMGWFVHDSNAAPGVPVQTALQRAVAESVTRLGDLDSSKRRIFDDEVVPLYQRFVKDYRPGANGLQIEIDIDAIQRYIAFYGPRTLRPADSKSVKILLFQSSDPTCSRCREQASAVERILRLRAERRGFSVEWVKESELPSERPRGAALREWLLGIADSRKALGVISVETTQSEVDAAHPDEVTYRASVTVAVKPKDEAILRFAGDLSLMPIEPMDGAVGRLLSDAFSQFGERALMVERESIDEKTRELQIVVRGIRDRAQFVKIREGMISAFPDAVYVEERRIRRGEVTFGIRTGRSTEQISRQIASVSGEGAKMTVTMAAGERIEAEAK